MWLFKSFDKKRTQNLLKLSIERMTMLINKKKAPARQPAAHTNRINPRLPPVSPNQDCPCPPALIRYTMPINGAGARPPLFPDRTPRRVSAGKPDGTPAIPNEVKKKRSVEEERIHLTRAWGFRGGFHRDPLWH
ncbi:hypothetical protein T484DRAFT_1749472 [Baffinella frigidus]|nr:hypothetical protein T484DRAFT_1749472 [Cryptophyta sp. CCMP2293]